MRKTENLFNSSDEKVPIFRACLLRKACIEGKMIESGANIFVNFIYAVRSADFRCINGSQHVLQCESFIDIQISILIFFAVTKRANWFRAFP